MKTRKSFKGILSLVLLTAIFSLSLASMAFADAPTVLWKETKNSDGSQLADAVGYDPADGTFEDGARVITSTGGHQYYLGVEFSEAVTSGKVIVDAKFSNVSTSGPVALFDLNNSWVGNSVKSGLVFNGTRIQNQNISNTWITATDGMFNLKFVAVAGNAESPWYINIYNGEIADANLIHSYSMTREQLPAIKCITNNGWVASGKTTTLTVNKFKVEIIENPTLEITSATDGNVAYDAPLSVTFDSAIDDTTISGIKLKQGETEVNATVELGDQTNTVTITPASHLVDEQKYQIVIPTTVTSVSGLTLSNPEIINITAVDAIYYTNAGSKYNPTTPNASVTPTFESGKAIFATGYPKFSMGKIATSGVYYFDLKYRLSGSNYLKLGLVKGSTNSGLYMFEKGNLSQIRALVNSKTTYTYEYIYNSTNYHVLKPQYDPSTIYYNTTDTSNNIFDLRVVVESASETDDWKVSVYDKAAPERGAIYVGRYTKTELPGIGGFAVDKAGALQFELYDLIIREKDDVNVASYDYDDEKSTAKVGFATIKNGVAIAAGYASNGRLVEAQSKALTYQINDSIADDLSFTFKNSGSIAYMKFMVWDGFTGCKPLLLKPYE